jgi:hypothetical protein
VDSFSEKVLRWVGKKSSTMGIKRNTYNMEVYENIPLKYILINTLNGTLKAIKYFKSFIYPKLKINLIHIMINFLQPCYLNIYTIDSGEKVLENSPHRQAFRQAGKFLAYVFGYYVLVNVLPNMFGYILRQRVL